MPFTGYNQKMQLYCMLNVQQKFNLFSSNIKGKNSVVLIYYQSSYFGDFLLLQ
jgi:hypothetical protein